MSDEVLRELDHITEQLCRSEAATQNISISEDCIGAIKKVVAAQLSNTFFFHKKNIYNINITYFS